jgi:hypothetical protein
MSSGTGSGEGCGISLESLMLEFSSGR